MDIEKLHKEIKTFKDFLLALGYVIENTGLLCFKNSQDANSINSNSKQLLSYYIREKNKRIDKIHSYSKVYKIEFKDWSVNFDEQYDKFLEEVKEIYFSDKESNFTIKKTLSQELTIYFKEVVNSIWIAFYNFKIKELKDFLFIETNTFNDLVFNNETSEAFFNYVVENWIKEEPKKVTALRFVFSEMWYKNLETETSYKITSTQPYFAREYWNKKYSNILKLHPKNPKLKEDSFIDYYHKRFKNLLNEFKGG
jgi:hypothetical protein